MIVLLHPRSTKPKNRRFPLAMLHLAAVLEGREEYEIVDGNVEPDAGARLDELTRNHRVELLAVSVMPGPQMKAAIPLCREFRSKHPLVPIAWGGYFPSIYTDATLNAPYVDYAVRGQGEDTLVELIAALRSRSGFENIRGLSYKNKSSLRVAGQYEHNAERSMKAPDEYPWPPYDRLDASKYILPTFLGSRTTVHQASIGCPYKCNFCGVITAYGSRQKMESPARTAEILKHQQDQYGINAVQFYDNNFFLREDHAVDLAERIAPLQLKWWSEARVDIVLRYKDETLRKLRDSGATMIFFGAESGSDWALKEMNKQLEAHQTLDLARRLKDFGIIPEFSFVVGNPRDPERDVRELIEFVRKIKRLNPASEIILQHYVPVPQRTTMYGQVDSKMEFPTTPEEWASDHWYEFTVRTNPRLPWLPVALKKRIDGFEQVISSRWPTMQDRTLPRWGRWALGALASWRYAFEVYENPFELRWMQKLLALRKPRLESL